MKILSVGAGMIGAIVAQELSRENEVTVFDANKAALDKLAAKGGSIKTEHGSVYDAGKFNAIIAANDIVVIAMPGSLAIVAAESALNLKKPVFDISSIPNEYLMNKIQPLANEKETLYVPKIGIAPGMTNFLTGRGCFGMDKVKTVKIYVGGIPQDKDAYMGYKTVFCLNETLQEYLDPALIVENGSEKYTDAMSYLHKIEFDGLGELEAFATDGLATLSKTITAENMYEFTIRWAGHIRQIKDLITLGMFEENKSETENVSPKEFFVKRLEPLWRMDSTKGDRDLTLFRIIIDGTKGDAELRRVWECVDRYDEEKNITSMGKCTAFTCVAFIQAWQKSLFDNKGFVFPEKLASNDELYYFIMSSIAKKGVHFTEEQTILKDF